MGGVATQKFGTKSVFGWSQFATGICSLLIPVGASTHYSLLIILRSVQGFASGLTWPAMYALVGYWIPPSERSRFMSSFQGFSIGIGLTYPLVGFILSKFSWHTVFYVTGTIGLSWCVLWYFLAYNTPSKHPRISKEELNYIHSSVSDEIKAGEGMKVPWKAIFTSLPAWSIGITTFGRIWVHYTFIVFGPQFMKHMLKFDIKSNGVLNGLPFLLSYLSSVLFCYIADCLVERNVLSLTNVRKIFTAASQILPGILVVCIGYLGVQDIVSVLVLWFAAVSLITAAYAGAMATIVDIAPNLAGPVLAFAQTIHMSASFLQPLVTEQIITDKVSVWEERCSTRVSFELMTIACALQESVDQWMYSFYLTCVITIVTYAMYQIYGTSKIQPWNYPPKKLLQTDDIRQDETPEDVDYNTRLKQQFINI